MTHFLTLDKPNLMLLIVGISTHSTQKLTGGLVLVQSGWLERRVLLAVL